MAGLRKGSVVKHVYKVLAYLIGQNLMTAGRGWLEDGKIATGLGLWRLIVPIMAIALWLYFTDGRLGRRKAKADGARA